MARGDITSAFMVFTSDTVANGNYDFNTDNPDFGTNIVEYVSFVNAGGDVVEPTAGAVTITAASGNGVFQGLDNNTFNAADANSDSRTKPSGLGRAVVLRVELSGGVTGNSVAGFRVGFTQSAS